MRNALYALFEDMKEQHQKIFRYSESKEAFDLLKENINPSGQEKYLQLKK